MNPVLVVFLEMMVLLAEQMNAAPVSLSGPISLSREVPLQATHRLEPMVVVAADDTIAEEPAIIRHRMEPMRITSPIQPLPEPEVVSVDDTRVSEALAAAESDSLVTGNRNVRSAHSGQPRVVIIIDDLGHNWVRDRSVIDLPPEIALAVLPNSPYGLKIARQGWESGHEILIHLPLQGGDSEYAEPDTLTLSLDEGEFLAQLRESLKRIPYAIGVNNHQGSVLTSAAEPMQWLMSELKSRDQHFFLDSRTTATSVAMKTARDLGVPALSRRVFLDHDMDVASMDQSFAQMIRIARREGQAIAIAHPHRSTLNWLIPKLDELNDAGIALAAPTELLNRVPSRMSTMQPPDVLASP